MGCALEQALRRPAYLRVGERRLVDSIASEELVGALARKHGLHLGGGNLVDEVQRHGRRVGGGLVHVPLHARKARPVFFFADVLVGVGDMQVVRQLARPRNLVAHGLAAGAFGIVRRRLLVALEAHGERFDVGVLLGQARRHVAGVDARRQEASDLDVGHVVIAHAVTHDLVDCARGVLAVAVFIEVVLGAPVAALGDGTVGVHGHAVRGCKLEDALEESLRQRAELEAQVLLECLAIELAGVGGVLQNTFDLGREDELAVLLRVVKRFDAEEIARAEKLACRAVPDGEREHAAQSVEHAFAPCEIAREQHFRVGFRLELPALRLEFGAKVLVVVDFPVEHDGEIALREHGLGRAAWRAVGHERGGGDGRVVFACRANHGLVAVRQVDEREAAVPERDAAFRVEILALAVGPAMGHDVAHGLERGGVSAGRLGESADSAHAKAPSYRCRALARSDSRVGRVP